MHSSTVYHVICEILKDHNNLSEYSKKADTHTEHTENKLVVDNRERGKGEHFEVEIKRGTNLLPVPK